MPIKRRNHGRQKKNRGSTCNKQCIQCGAIVAKDKAVSRCSNMPIIELAAMDDLRAANIYEKPEVPTFMNMDTYCISCACHLRIVKVRSKNHRKDHYVPKGMRVAEEIN